MKPQLVPGTRALALPKHPHVLRVFPHGKELTAKPDMVFVRHGVAETRLLRRLNATIPCPLETHYRWPRKPWQAQQATASMLAMHRRAYVLNEMGTGKTFTTLAAADFLMDENEIQRALIVAPVSTLGPTWQKEILQWFPHRSAVVLHGTAAKRRQLLAEKHDFYLINHDGVEILIDELTKRRDIGLIVFDELAVYRNGRPGKGRDGKIKHRLFFFAQKLVVDRNYVWGLTGAPCPNEPLDAWAQVRLITPSRVPSWWTDFRDQVMTKVGTYTWLPKAGAMETVYQVMQPAVRFSLQECADLPEIIEETRDATLSPTQRKAYQTMMDAVQRNIAIDDATGKPHFIDQAHAAVQHQKLMQIACGWVYDDQHKVVHLNPKDRLSVLKDMVDSTSQKVLVFVPFLHVLDGVAAFLRKHGITCETISSKTTLPKRNDIFDRFQHRTDPRALVAHPKTMSHGLTLTAANVIVWFAPPSSYDTYLQANRRIRRPGQAHSQVLVHLSGTPVEARTYHRLRKRGNALDALLGLFASGTPGDDP